MTQKSYAIVLFAGMMGTILIWGFVAGWAGEIRFLPDRPAEIGGLIFIVVMYTPVALSVWAAWRLCTRTDLGLSDD